MMYLNHFLTFVKEITKNNSRNYKLEVLNRYKDDDIVKYFLDFIYNPYITTGISKKKISKDMSDIIDSPWGFGVIEFDTVKDLLEHVKANNTGTTDTLAAIQNFRETVEEMTPELDELLENIITKNVQLGVDVLTINKVMPNLIPTFNVQLANKYFDKPEVVEGKEFALTTKIDGGRIIAIKKNGEARFYTRQGQEYEGLVDLKEEMEAHMPDNICLDGEITLLNPYVVEKDEEGRPAIRRKLSSKEQYKETMKITRKDGEKHGIKMKVFDCMLAEDFENQKCDIEYWERRMHLNMIFKGVRQKTFGGYTYFELLPLLYEGDDISKITEILEQQIAQGEEGIMINIRNAPYEFKRTNNLLKVKKMNDLDLPVLDFEEGTNRHAGKLGAIITEYKGCKLKVGSGFSDDLREEIWNNKEDYRGLTMVVQYFEETTNQQGGVSLRFPVFLDFRTDK